MKTMILFTVIALTAVLSGCGEAQADAPTPTATAKAEKVVVGKPIGTFKELCPETHPLSQGWGINKSGQRVHNCRALETAKARAATPEDALEAAE